MFSPEVHLCIAAPDSVPAAVWRELHATLDEDERRREASFRVEADCLAYVLAHGLRRTLLARELQVAPSALRFAADANGKPVLADPAEPSLFFSHSRNRRGVALAFTRVGPVGVDLEFADDERADFALLEPFVDLPREREGDFSFYWTALEAFWKAAGVGLAEGNPRIRCRRTRDDEAEVTTEADGYRAPRARIFHVPATPGCVAAVAVGINDAMKLVHCTSPFGFLPLIHGATAP
jgi:phosphopantetheinyl transferase